MEQIQKGKRTLEIAERETSASKRPRRLATTQGMEPNAAIDTTVHDVEEELNRRQEELERLERAVNQKASTIVILEQEWKVGHLDGVK